MRLDRVVGFAALQLVALGAHARHAAGHLVQHAVGSARDVGARHFGEMRIAPQDDERGPADRIAPELFGRRALLGWRLGLFQGRVGLGRLLIVQQRVQLRLGLLGLRLGGVDVQLVPAGQGGGDGDLAGGGTFVDQLAPIIADFVPLELGAAELEFDCIAQIEDIVPPSRFDLGQVGRHLSDPAAAVGRRQPAEQSGQTEEQRASQISESSQRHGWSLGVGRRSALPGQWGRAPR